MKRKTRQGIGSAAWPAAAAAAVAAASLILAARSAAAPVEVRLARDGKALREVVVAPDASQRVRAAANDLAAYLGRIAGVGFEVKEGAGAAGIAVGTGDAFGAAAGAAFDIEDPFGREDYLLRTHAGGAWLIGATERAVEHAIWDFLHRLGYRLFFLTDTWEIVPETPDLRMAVDARERPDYVTRRAPAGAPWSDRALWKRWRTRNRVASEFALATSHAYDGIIRANAEAFREHPEYYALVDGERRHAGRVDGRGNIKFCVSNPGLRNLLVDHAVRAMRAAPDRDSFSMDPSDGGGWCECDACEAMGSVTDRVLTLANEAAEAINRLGLGDKYVGIYAYGFHSPPPTFDVHPRVVVSVATGFIRGGYTIEELVEGWSARGATLGVREYHDVFQWSHDMPRRARGGRISYLRRTIPFFHEEGARFMVSENSDSWGANGLGYWLSPILLWDVSAADRVDAYVEDFLEKAFGPAREPMRAFYRLINIDESPRTSEDLTGRMYRALDAARGLTDDPAVRARLEDLALYTRYVELYHRYREASGAARQAAFERIWRHAYRMRDRLLVMTVAVCHRDRFRDTSVRVPEDAAWSVPEDINPWKSSEPFGDREIADMIAAGIAANPVATIDFEPVRFSDELAPAALLNLPDVAAGSFPERSRGTREYLIWMREPGAIELRVTGGLIRHYRNRGNVRISLFSPKELTLEAVAYDASVPPDGVERRVILTTPHDGLHTLELTDGSDMTELIPPEGLPFTFRSGIETPPGRALRGRWSLYFYVPLGTRVVGGFTRDRSGRMRDGAGNEVLSFDTLERPGYFRVAVPEGGDGQLWKIENSSGEKLLMTVPPYLARTGRELLLPREVIEADRKRATTVTERGPSG